MSTPFHPHALVPITDGTEEIEAVSIIDVLRRAGIEVTVAGVGTAGRPAASLHFTASRGVGLMADKSIESIERNSYAAIVLPGGMPGAAHLRDCPALTRMLADQDRAGRLVAAICASPVVVLQSHGLLRGRGATCYPGMREQMEAASRRPGRVVQDGNLLTSQGPGTALDFALAVVAHLCGPGRRGEVAAQLLMV